jgi:two-component system phosphate regulon sensor histidine kinase PhoR
VFSLALRIGLRIAAVTAIVSALVFMGFREWHLSVLYGVLIGFVTFLVSYLTILSLVSSRINKLRKLLQSIYTRRFDFDTTQSIERKDELDILFAEALHSSRTIESEFLRLMKLENYRKEFIGDLSHELKTPIFAIQGFLETLLDGAIDDEEVNRKFLKKAMNNVNRLNVLTRDLMEIAKLETGELQPILQPVQLQQILQEVFETLSYHAEEENISLVQNKMEPNLTVVADRNQLRQVFQNLIENAIKYNNPGGSVTVGVYPYTRRDSKIWVYVRDTGVGIHEKDLKRVTERFYRVDKSRSRDKGGSGLGLAIVKHIIESHGDQMRISSQPGKGTVFSFSLQLADRLNQ